MPDPYEILGVKRGASLGEIKAAYRRAAKERHPDRAGGSTERMTELNIAYAFIINELKHGFQEQEKEETKREQSTHSDESAWHDVGDDTAHNARDTYWRNLYREIDEELDGLRRAAEQYEEQLRSMRNAAWSTGQHAAWARLTWNDLLDFFRRTARSGVKGLALLFAALVGVGSVLVEANIVSALILVGSGVGLLFSLALRNDKGGILSAALLLFGIMTIWLPPVRQALFLYPLSTISVLILLALIFKFAQTGGTVGMMTGGVLAFYVISVIVGETTPHPLVDNIPPRAPPFAPHPLIPPSPTATPTPAQSPRAPTPSPTVALLPPEPRTLLAADGAILKFVSGVPYHLKVRNGRATFLHATQGTVKLTSGDDGSGECVDSLHFLPEHSNGPWHEIAGTIRACGSDAIFIVHPVN